MMLGGSPMRVEVPPTLEASTCANRYGQGSTRSCRVMASVTGAMSSTVVTLSTRAEKTAVTMARSARMAAGRAPASLTARMATYSKSPVRRVIPTISIMPVSSMMVLKSTPRIASSCVRMPDTITRQAPMPDTRARLTRSTMMAT